MIFAANNRKATVEVSAPSQQSHQLDVQQVRGVELVNISSYSLAHAVSFMPQQLLDSGEVERVVLFPDLSPNRAPIPTGSVVKFIPGAKDWRHYAISDCGCGMLLLDSKLRHDQFSPEAWDAVGLSLRRNKGGLGDLGGGNHFVDALVSTSTGLVSFLIHTGSRYESGHVEEYVDKPGKFEEKFEEVSLWASENRLTIRHALEAKFGPLKRVLDLPHNTIELHADESVTLRKGAVKVRPGDLTILPSALGGQVALLKAATGVSATLDSLAHGTGRTLARGQARTYAEGFNFAELRNTMHIPSYIEDSSLRTEIPGSYRQLDEVLGLLGDLTIEQERFDIIAYLGHL